MLDLVRFESVLSGLKKADATKDVYVRSVSLFFNKFSEVTEENIQKFILDLSSVGKSPTTIRTYVYGVYSYAKIFNIEINTYLITLPKGKFRESSYVTKETFEQGLLNIKTKLFVGDFKYSVLCDFFYVLYNTGMRIAEISGITKDSIFIDGGYTYIKVIGKGNKERRIPIDREIVDILKKESIYRFIENTSYYYINKYCKLFFGDGITPHSFRHGYVTKLIDNGADHKSVQKVVGHESFATTMRYFHKDMKQISDSVLSAIHKEELNA